MMALGTYTTSLQKLNARTLLIKQKHTQIT